MGSVQATFTYTIIEEQWAHGDKERTRRRHQLALAEVGRELISFNSTKELLEVFIHVIEGTNYTFNFLKLYLMCICI